jgi:peptidoglycan/LPS O-acetylase OafA/YrhL
VRKRRPMSEAANKYDYIDALRGWAILGVVSVHCVQQTPGLPEPWRTWLYNGQYGVQLFFLASALTLLISWHRRNDGVLPFFIRRLFRIVPVYWLAIAVYAVSSGGETLRVALPTAVFVNYLVPPHFVSAVPGGWTITAEMMFYVVFPLLAARVVGVRKAMLAALGAYLGYVVITLAYWGLVQPDHMLIRSFVFVSGPVWFPGALTTFLLGFVVYYASRRWRPHQALVEMTIPACFGLFLLASLANPYPLLLPPLLAPIVWAMTQGGGRYLLLPPIRAIGKVSFSMYLWHFFVIEALVSWAPLPEQGAQRFAVLYALAVVITGAVAALTYLSLEQPFIRLGHRTAHRIALSRVGQDGGGIDARRHSE